MEKNNGIANKPSARAALPSCHSNSSAHPCSRSRYHSNYHSTQGRAHLRELVRKRRSGRNHPARIGLLFFTRFCASKLSSNLRVYLHKGVLSQPLFCLHCGRGWNSRFCERTSRGSSRAPPWRGRVAIHHANLT